MQSVVANLGALGLNVINRRGLVGGLVGWLVDIALVALAAVLVARFIWLIIAPGANITLPANSYSPSAQEGRKIVWADPSILKRFNPFDRDFQAAPIVTEDAPETSLNLKIRGLFASTDSSQSSVRLQMPDNSVKRFVVGSEVIDGVTVDRILSDRVEIIRNGEREILLERGPEMRVLSRVNREDDVTQTTAFGTEVADGPASEQQSNGLVLSGYVPSVPAFYQIATVTRILEEGQKAKLVITATRDQSALESSGLAVKDELVRVNGFDLAEDSLGDIYEVLLGTDRMAVELIRGGRPVTVNIVVGEDE